MVQQLKTGCLEQPVQYVLIMIVATVVAFAVSWILYKEETTEKETVNISDDANKTIFVERLDDMWILIDNSIVEVYISGGEYVMTARYYMAEKQLGIIFGGVSFDNSIFENTKIWQMNTMEVQYE